MPATGQRQFGDIALVRPPVVDEAYTARRRHSAIRYPSPVLFEDRHADRTSKQRHIPAPSLKPTADGAGRLRASRTLIDLGASLQRHTRAQEYHVAVEIWEPARVQDAINALVFE